MRPLYHPALEEVNVQGILYALADPVRAGIFADITMQECSEKCSAFLTASDRTIPKSTLSLHFRILRENGLVRGERHGVEMRHTSRFTEIEGRFPGLLQSIVQAYLEQSPAKPKPPSRKAARAASARTKSARRK